MARGLRSRVGGAGSPRGVRLAALAAAAMGAALAGCATPTPQVTRSTVTRVPGESVIVARLQIPGAVSGLTGAAEADALRVTIQTEGTQVVRPTPLTPAGYLLATLPPGRYRLTAWESRAQRATHYGPLDLPFEVPQPDRLYYLGTIAFEAQTAERYRIQVGDQFDEAMRYLVADHTHLAGPFERRLLAPPARQ